VTLGSSAVEVNGIKTPGKMKPMSDAWLEQAVFYVSYPLNNLSDICPPGQVSL
jgi:aerobic-type carbon monoxide dehydrogenase small subunit (CoxS/CutS family)